MSREREVSRLFVDLADSLVTGYEVQDLLQRLVDGVKSVLGADAVGVLLGATKDRLSLSAASDAEMETLELFELQAETGPCYAAYAESKAIAIDDLGTTADRWPDFTPRALELGFCSVHAFPLRLRDDTIGALNCFRRATGGLSDEDLHLGQALADIATIGILQERAVKDAEVRASQLQYALDSRIVVEQAKGQLAERLGISTAEAFDRIRSHSRRTNTKLREICRKVLHEGFTPD